MHRRYLGAGGFDRVLLKERGHFHIAFFIVCPASVFSHGDEDQLNREFAADPGHSFREVVLAGQPLDFIIGNLQNIAFSKSPANFFFCMLQRIPQRFPEIGIKSLQERLLLLPE